MEQFVVEGSRRRSFAALPTPLETAGSLPSGRRLLVKRDDLTGLGMGGNKVRKLEYLVADAIATGADTLVTVGAAQSNHARATAAAGARVGLDTYLVLGGHRPEVFEGNQLLSSLFGAVLHYADTDAWPELSQVVDTVVERLRADGRTPYAIPLGGSTPIGAMGFVAAWEELVGQLANRDHEVGSVVMASSTGGTHAGMLAGRAVHGGPTVIAADVAKEHDDLGAHSVELANRTLGLLGRPERLERADAHLDDRFVGPAYAVPTDEADRAMVGLARSGGWVLDRVYTAKAMACLIARDAEGSLPDGDVVFWHTGGQPATFATGGMPTLTSDIRPLLTDLEPTCH